MGKPRKKARVAPAGGGIGARVAALRDAAEINQYELGRFVRKSHAWAGLLEAGRISTVMADAASALAELFGCSMEYLISGKGAPPTKESVKASVARARERGGTLPMQTGRLPREKAAAHARA